MDPVVVIARVGALCLFLVVSLLATACGPDCRRACRHMLEDCGIDRPGLDVEDCTNQCSSFLTHYSDDWQVAESKAAVRCVNQASCEELQTGTACYDAAVYVW